MNSVLLRSVGKTMNRVLAKYTPKPKAIPERPKSPSFGPPAVNAQALRAIGRFVLPDGTFRDIRMSYPFDKEVTAMVPIVDSISSTGTLSTDMPIKMEQHERYRCRLSEQIREGETIIGYYDVIPPPSSREVVK